ncbi:MAG: KamA family radical SAM protein [Methanomicrobiaceae archaeon]|nr:KamA family radical SAM protein [Methanomicrobiaceae archaeon]
MKPQYVTDIEHVVGLTNEEKISLKKVTRWFAFRANDYYLSLIRWKDAEDPIRRLIIPHEGELDTWGTLDPSSEERFTVAPGVQHKYGQTALMLVSDMCGGFCRFCFRKRIFVDDDSEVAFDMGEGLDYIRNHPEISNVLISGGDPLMLPTPKLEAIVAALRTIDHVRIIRIGSKIPAYNPFRITQDPSLLRMIARHSTPARRIYVMTHFDHPREMTDAARRAIAQLQQSGAILMNQTPLIRGVNDNPVVLAELFNQLSYAGISPYYVFQCRPSTGNKIYTVPVEEAYRIVEMARARCSGLAKSARFVMSHASGKIEVTGNTAKAIIFRYNQAAESDNTGRVLVYARNPRAYWFDDYTDCITSYRVSP